MTAFLILVVIILFAVSVWQMNKIFMMSRPKDTVDTQIANDKDNKINGYLMLGFVIFIYVLSFLSFYLWWDILLPEAASEHGVEIDQLWLISMILIFIVGIITQWLLHYFAFKYAGKKGQRATFYADNDRLEFIWTIVPVVVLAGLIIYGLFTWSDIMNVDIEEEDPMIIELYAYQFDWRARYAGDDNTLGDASVRLIEGINQLGVDVADPDAQDDIIVNELHLPIGRKVLFKMRSQDVLHSAYMPHFRAQMNCVPGMVTQFAFTPSKTTEQMRMNSEIVAKVANINSIRNNKNKDLLIAGEELLEPYEFDFMLLCNKICGNTHYNMQMKIIVETPEEFEAWLATQKDFATTMKN